MREQSQLEIALKEQVSISEEINDLNELYTMAVAENDAATVLETIESAKALARRAKLMETEALFSGEADSNDCFIEIHAGAGGTESCDWAAMLQRMYMRWAEKHGYKIELFDEQEGDSAGIKSATIKVSGHNAYGWAKTESGVHRLVRISPFDSSNRRHTSFASVWVYPQVDDTIEIEIPDKEVRIDTYRASGAGGQHVNRTDSAVRITHLPTNIVVYSARTTEASTATVQRLGLCCARGYMNWNFVSAKRN